MLAELETNRPDEGIAPPRRTPCTSDLAPRATRGASLEGSAAARPRPGSPQGSISGGAAGDGVRLAIAALAPELFGRALRLTRSPAAAEDLVQDAVERALRFERHYRRGTNLRAWMHQILFRVFVSRCRRVRRERLALDRLAADPCGWSAPEPSPPPGELLPATARALAGIPAAYRVAVELVDLMDLSYKDAARLLGVPVGTVMSRLHRGRRRLAALLAPHRLAAAA